MSDEIPNDRYSVQCPNEKCGHMNLPWRRLCAICGTYLQAVVTEKRCRQCNEPIKDGNICGTCVNLNSL